MTLILTYINKFGIIHASDSNLTCGNQDTGKVKKTFDIPYLRAGLTFAGDFYFDGIEADKWIIDFIQQQSNKAKQTLKEFVEKLKDKIQGSKREYEINGGNIIHISGYVEKNNICYPEFYVISNINLDEKTGSYSVPQEEFKFSEDFMRRDCPENRLLERFPFDSTLSQIYINGYTSGKTSYLILQQVIGKFFEIIWNEKNWSFRPPENLKESESLVRLYLNIISTMFDLSNYSAHFIGGEPQIISIEQPINIAKNC